MKYIILCIAVTMCMHADNIRETVSGSQVEKNVAKVMKVYNWSDSVENLQQQAEKKNKMIFWLQVVGELDGGL